MKMVILHSYVSLPEGIFLPHGGFLKWGCPPWVSILNWSNFWMLNGSLYFRKPPYHHTIETSNDLVSKIGSSPLGPSIAIHSYSIFRFPTPFVFGRRIAKKHSMLILASSISSPTLGYGKCQNAESFVPQQQHFAMGSLAQLRCDPVQLQDQVPDKVPEGSGADTL